MDPVADPAVRAAVAREFAVYLRDHTDTFDPVVIESMIRSGDDIKPDDAMIEEWVEHGAHLRIGDAASGVDRFASEVWEHGAPWVQRFEQDRVQFYRAEWGRLRKQAGHVRNGWMIKGRDARASEEGGALRDHPSDALVAFFAPGPESRGTANAVEQASWLGIPVLKYHGGWDIDGMPAFWRILDTNPAPVVFLPGAVSPR